MDSDRIATWREADRLFGLLLDLPEGDRDAWLASLSIPKTTREALDRLIVEHAKDDALPVFDLSGDAVRDAEVERNRLAGRRVGAWELLEEIGRGGMSVVYRARRVDADFEQLAAVKLLSAATIGSQGTARFEQERRVLARLRHPHIAALIDGGVAADGSPYLVMSLVEGVDLARHCVDAALDWRECVRLMIDVCESVAHAHRNLLVHRDLKPTNILVTNEGVPVLLDFGIAKLLDVDAEVTATGVQPMTPAYAAPEQIRGEPVTTATDVHALGVILRTLCKHASNLPTDLRNVIAMATRPEPERRYPDARALGEDLQRLLSGHAVRATPDSPGYRLRAFLRRHRAWVATAGAITIVLVIGLVATLWQARRAEHQAEEALRQSARAEAVKGFLFSLFEAGDRERTGGKDPRVSELVERGVARLQTFAARPELHAEMATLLGRLDTALGRNERAHGLLDAALQSAERSGERDLVAQAQLGLGTLANAEGESERAVEFYERILDARVAGARHPEIEASALTGWAYAMQNLGRNEQADMRLARELDDPEMKWPPIQRGELLLGRSIVNREPQTTLSLVVEAQQQFALEPGGAIPELALQSQLAAAYGHVGRDEDAFEHHRRAAEIADRLYPGMTRNRARAHNNLGNAAERTHRLKRAAEAYNVAESIFRGLGDDHSPAFAALMHNRGKLLLHLGDPVGALDALAKALQLAEEYFGPDDRRTGIALRDVALARAAAHADPVAEAEWQRAVAASKGSTNTRGSVELLLVGSEIALELDRPADARQRLDDADALVRGAHLELTAMQSVLRQLLDARIDSLQGRAQSATERFEGALEGLQADGPSASAQLWKGERWYAEHLADLGRSAEAREHYSRAIDALVALGASEEAGSLIDLRRRLEKLARRAER